MAARSSGYKMTLNNYCQSAGRRYEFRNASYGPQNAATWVSIVYVDNVEFGRGQASTRLGAEETAAAQALALINQGY
ncbi:hypothetical protein Moror_7273 [Moniliophthora roreri MCA 2997]|uniref:DRBM domain-containing protein n=2 Tax=Moniliophthora roreri TaxID=221103 RepID=V2XQY4_MONRO|nr:hypothetical protein Moror_7273 [Moniliophthora roreri MCA 2997]